MDWPSQSPDLIPIENLWEELDFQVREGYFTNKNNLCAALHQKWKNMPIDRLIKLVNSMPQRCVAVNTIKRLCHHILINIIINFMSFDSYLHFFTFFFKYN